jgi:hypothetical protein
LLDRLARLESDGRTMLELLTCVVESLDGISANQRTLAENQRLVIECLSRLAERSGASD